jgi:hypothetical protein
MMKGKEKVEKKGKGKLDILHGRIKRVLCAGAISSNKMIPF